MAGKKRFLKFGALAALICLIVIALLWWRLPDVINFIAMHQFEKKGWVDAELQVEEADRKHLNISRAKLTGAGWAVQVGRTEVRYGLLKLITEKEAESVTLNELSLAVEPANLKKSGDPLTIDLLQSLPIKETTIKNGSLSLVFETNELTLNWDGTINRINDHGIEIVISTLQIDHSSSAGETLLSLPRLHDPEGLLKLFLALDGTNVHLRWNLENFAANGNGWELEEGSTAANFNFNSVNLAGLDLADSSVLLPRLVESISGTFNAYANQLKAGTISAQWLSSDLEITETAAIQAKLNSSAGLIEFAGDSLEQLSVEIESQGDWAQIESQGVIGFLYDGVDGNVQIKQTTTQLLEELTLLGEYKLSPMIFDYSDAIARHIDSLSDLSFSGTVEAKGHYTFAKESKDAAALITLTDATTTRSNSNLTASGLNVRLDLDSVMNLTSKPGESYVLIDQILVGDLEFKNSQLNFDLQNSKTLSLKNAETLLFGGRLYLEPGTLNWDPLEFDSLVRFERLSLKAIAEEMSLFRGTMEGAVSGFLPLAYRDGTFDSGEGRLELSEGETARLQYDTIGLLKKKVPQKPGLIERFTDRLLGQLELLPEQVVEDALGDLSISEFRVDLLSSETPETPIRIHLAGEGTSGKTTVPLILDTNINGTLEELFSFLLRINSLGTPSLQ